jgi:acyl-CoA thioester hydrolase
MRQPRAGAALFVSGERFEHRLRVRFGECDPQGIVFNAHYVAYFDVALTELWRAALGSWGAMVERGVDAVVAQLEVRFHAPARADDLITLAVGVEALGRTSLTTVVDVARDGELLVAGRLRHVFVDAGTWQKTPMPDWIREGLSPYLVTTSVD